MLDEEGELLQVVALRLPAQSSRLHDAYAALVEGLCAELADWVGGWAPELLPPTPAPSRCSGSTRLLGKRATAMLFHAEGVAVPDEDYVREWTLTLALRIEAALEVRPGP